MLGWSNDRGDLGLLEEPLLGRVVLRQLRRQHLDRHVPIQARVSGLIDDAHTAGYQAGRRFHMTELRTGSEGHGGELFYREGKSVMVVAVASTPSSWSPDGEALAQKPETLQRADRVTAAGRVRPCVLRRRATVIRHLGGWAAVRDDHGVTGDTKMPRQPGTRPNQRRRLMVGMRGWVRRTLTWDRPPADG